MGISLDLQLKCSWAQKKHWLDFEVNRSGSRQNQILSKSTPLKIPLSGIGILTDGLPAKIVEYTAKMMCVAAEA